MFLVCQVSCHQQRCWFLLTDSIRSLGFCMFSAKLWTCVLWADAPFSFVFMWNTSNVQNTWHEGPDGAEWHKIESEFQPSSRNTFPQNLMAFKLYTSYNHSRHYNSHPLETNPIQPNFEDSWGFYHVLPHLWIFMVNYHVLPHLQTHRDTAISTSVQNIASSPRWQRRFCPRSPSTCP